MDVYKLSVDEMGYRRISSETLANLEAETLRKPPYCQARGTDDVAWFAVCPACDNPIQIIGLYRLPRGVRQPYGRHTGNSVPQLAVLDPEARDACMYFNPRPRRKDERKKHRHGLPTKILTTLIEQFDRVLYWLEKETGIRYSRHRVKAMLERYRAGQGYLYTGATLLNIPWIFAYMTDSQPLFGQHVGRDTPLAAAIRAAIPAAEVDDDGRVVSKLDESGNKAGYFDLDVCFIHHRFRHPSEDAALEESMTMVVSTVMRSENKRIYEQAIVFDHDRFQRLIGLPVDHPNRRWGQVELARDVLGDLCDET